MDSGWWHSLTMSFHFHKSTRAKTPIFSHSLQKSNRHFSTKYITKLRDSAVHLTQRQGMNIFILFKKENTISLQDTSACAQLCNISARWLRTIDDKGNTIQIMRKPPIWLWKVSFRGQGLRDNRDCTFVCKGRQNQIIRFLWTVQTIGDGPWSR